MAVVTGGTRGIGRAIAERLLDEGAHVALCGTRQKSVDDALAALSPRGRVFGMVADVSKIDDVRRFIAGAHAEFGALHILVNNAGAGAFANVAQLSPEAWDKMIALNLSGVHYCCHEIMPIFKQAGGGDVVNIGSLAGVNAFAGGAGYNASKFGLVGYSEAMMLDHRHDGVRVSLIMPGSVDTEFGSAALPASESAIKRTEPRGRTPHRLENCTRGYRGYRGERIEDAGQDTVSRVEVRPSHPPRKT